jgi:DNA-binding transcriptional LysR family regulator
MSAPAKKTLSSVSSPILACSVLTSTGAGASGDAASAPNTPAAPSRRRPFQSVIWLGCTSKSCASSERVFSPFIAAKATIAFEGLQSHRSWTVGGGPAARTVAIHPRFSVNTADAIIEAAAAGLGIARIMSYQAAGAVSEHRLALLLEAFAADPIPVNLVHQPQRISPLKRRAFLDYVVPRLNMALERVAQVVDLD